MLDSAVAERPGLRMKELAEATGVPKSTILYYLNQGLLPEPVRTGQNMAYYDPQCINRIRYIQNLQRRHRLSLAEIRRMIADRGEQADLSVYVALNDIIFGSSDPENSLDESAFCRETGLTRHQVRLLLRKRLLMPLIKGRFDRNDSSMGRIYARLLGCALTADDLTYYVDLGEKIIEHEMAVRRRLTHHLRDDEDAAMSMELVKDARMTRAYIIDRLFQHRVASMRDLKTKDSA